MLPIDIYERIAALRESGFTYDKIAAQLGISTDQAKRAYAKVRGNAVQRLSTPPGTPVAAAAPLPSTPKSHPKGWEPGFTLEGQTGTICSAPSTDRVVAWDKVLENLGLDPELFEVQEPVHVRSWDAAIGNGETKRFYYHRANVRIRRSADDRVDIEELKAEIRDHQPAPPAPTGDQAFVVNLADWQMGKRDGDGTNGVVGRVLDAIDSVERRVAELRAQGRQLGVLYVTGMGDLHEGCDGHYAMQTFEAELDRRDQTKVTRRLILAALRRWSPLFEKVVVTCVPGNHGENRKNGKLFTSWGDNDDVAVFEQVAEILAENPETYGHVTFVIPRDELCVTLDMAGTVTSMIHGHQVRGRTGVEAWWKGQALGRQPAGDADLLINGHFHGFVFEELNGRLHLQCPALESESTWVKNRWGAPGMPAVLTFVTSNGIVQDVELL